MKNLLVKYKGDWADELEVEGFWVTTKEEYEEWLIEIKNSFPYTYYIGTNEEIEYESLDSLQYDLSVKEITQEQFDNLKVVFGGSFGFFPDPEVFEEEDN
jgi:hypothetical protein